MVSSSTLKELGTDASIASSSYWRLRRDCPSYNVELWTVEHTGQVEQQNLLSCKDLAQGKVHIFDCFFEVYVLLSFSSEKDSIRAALKWVRGFTKVAGSTRPFPPMSLVLCPGSKLPRDLRAVFRTDVVDGLELRVLEIESAELLLSRTRFRYHELQAGTAIGCDIHRLDHFIDLQDFAIAMGIDQQKFERSSALEQAQIRRAAAAKLLGEDQM